MKFKKLLNNSNTEFEGPVEIFQEVFKDSRGYFFETWNEKKFNNMISKNVSFVQDNQSYSEKGTLRGLHYQLDPEAQGKLVRATTGKVFDVIVDLRINSKTFSNWAGIILDSETKNQIWIPQGFAHGFLTLSEEAIVEYKVTNFWNKVLDRSLLWSDHKLSIEWPFSDLIKSPNLSKKDSEASSLSTVIEKGDIFK
tara:strand:+ start:3415 stop:4002 length:588 start_codon:yes stop_codon:yes gene_type:complete